jgi:NADH-quinone oxidoreductase subunit F
MKIAVGQGSCGTAAGAGKIHSLLKSSFDANGVSAELTITGCIGMCFFEPIVDIYTDDGTLKRLVRITEKDVAAITSYAAGGDDALIDALLVREYDCAFLEKQTRIALRHCGVINPENLGDYIADDGYRALKKALSMTPEEVIEEIKVSGLAGRGGAGFPTWFKWDAARKNPGDEKYLICNADEGDPGAFMDRAVIESDPHNLIEGMLIAAYAIGAQTAVVYVPPSTLWPSSVLNWPLSRQRRTGFSVKTLPAVLSAVNSL